MFLAGSSGSFLQKQILKVQWLSQPCLGNTNVVPCWLVQHHCFWGFSGKQVQLQITTHHAGGNRQFALCHYWNILADLESALPPENVLFLRNAPLWVHTWSKSPTFVTHAAVITIIFPSAPSKMGCLLRCSSYQLLFPPMGGCMPVKGEWWCCWWWGERTETEERCWKGQAFNEQENMWASP